MRAEQVGFLNVHSQPDNPYRTDNVVAQLTDGQIVQVRSCPRQVQAMAGELYGETRGE